MRELCSTGLALFYMLIFKLNYRVMAYLCYGRDQGQGHHHMPETRGLCLSEEQTISTVRMFTVKVIFVIVIFLFVFNLLLVCIYQITRRPKVGAGRIMDMFTEPYKLIRRCEVTAILILYSLPRLLTGSILAHEMMHAWLRLKGLTFLSLLFSFLISNLHDGLLGRVG